jgi:hypothetical protein
MFLRDASEVVHDRVVGRIAESRDDREVVVAVPLIHGKAKLPFVAAPPEPLPIGSVFATHPLARRTRLAARMGQIPDDEHPAHVAVGFPLLGESCVHRPDVVPVDHAVECFANACVASIAPLLLRALRRRVDRVRIPERHERDVPVAVRRLGDVEGALS